MCRILIVLALVVPVLPGCRDAVAPRRVIQVCDWHYVNKELFTADLRAEGNHNDDEIDRLYAKFLNDVEAIQQEQIEDLRMLFAAHGIKRVWIEGLTGR